MSNPSPPASFRATAVAITLIVLAVFATGLIIGALAGGGL